MTKKSKNVFWDEIYYFLYILFNNFIFIHKFFHFATDFFYSF